MQPTSFDCAWWLADGRFRATTRRPPAWHAGAVRRLARPFGECSNPMNAALLAVGSESAASREERYRRSVVLTAIMGARRAWTASMISALSMPCR
jgi:hypothetical protein